MNEITKDDLFGWRQNPVTQQFLKDLEEELQSERMATRIAQTIDETVLHNAKTQGYIEGLEQLESWYEMKMEELNED